MTIGMLSLPGAIHYGKTLQAICEKTGLPIIEMEKTLGEIAHLIEADEKDTFGRHFKGKALLSAPYYAVKVTGALFHTQGGLCVDAVGRVLRPDGSTLQNLYAGGGAARGISRSRCLWISCWKRSANRNHLRTTCWNQCRNRHWQVLNDDVAESYPGNACVTLPSRHSFLP